MVFVAFCCFCCIGRRKNNTKQHNATLVFQCITLNVSRLQQMQQKQQQIVVSLRVQRFATKRIVSVAAGRVSDGFGQVSRPFRLNLSNTLRCKVK